MRFPPEQDEMINAEYPESILLVGRSGTGKSRPLGDRHDHIADRFSIVGVLSLAVLHSPFLRTRGSCVPPC